MPRRQTSGDDEEDNNGIQTKKTVQETVFQATTIAYSENQHACES